MKEIKVSTLRKKLKKQLKYVSKSKKALIVSGKKPKKDVVIMSIDEYNSLKDKVKSSSKNATKKKSKEATAEIENEVVEETKNDEEIEGMN